MESFYLAVQDKALKKRTRMVFLSVRGRRGESLRTLSIFPLEHELKKHTEASEAATKQNACCRAAKSRQTHRFDILPGNDVVKEIRSNLSESEPKQSTQDHTGESATSDNKECVFPGYHG